MYCESKHRVVKPFILSLGKFSETLGFRGMVCAGLSYSSKNITVSSERLAGMCWSGRRELCSPQHPAEDWLNASTG